MSELKYQLPTPNESPKIEDARPVSLETEKTHFNFEEIANFEDSLCSLVEELKAEFLAGAYDVFISDDTGGRIITLILRGIYKKVNPQADLAVNFVSGGHYLEESEENELEIMTDYLARVTKEKKRGLLIVQYISTGHSIALLAHLLGRAGFDNKFDVAVLDAQKQPVHNNNIVELLGEVGSNKIAIGGSDSTRHYHGGLHGVYTGVEKDEIHYTPHPISTREGTKRLKDRFALENKYYIFGITDEMSSVEVMERFKNLDLIRKYQQFLDEPLRTDELEDINSNVQAARQDVQLMVERVFQKVFGI